MTARYVQKLQTRADRQRAHAAIDAAVYGDTVTITGPKLTPEQNRKFHATCGDLEKSGFQFAGKPRTKDDWKVILISGHAVATRDEAEVIVGIEGEVINLRESMAEMGKDRGSSLIEYAVAFCAHHSIPDSRLKHSAVARAVAFLREAAPA